jgi:hypothetical protein
MHEAIFNLSHPAHYFGIGPFSISVGNAAMIGSLAILFLLALIIPFPHSSQNSSSENKKSENKKSENEK